MHVLILHIYVHTHMHIHILMSSKNAHFCTCPRLSQHPDQRPWVRKCLGHTHRVWLLVGSPLVGAGALGISHWLQSQGLLLPSLLLVGVGQGGCWNLLLVSPPCTWPFLCLVSAKSCPALPDLQWERVLELCNKRPCSSQARGHGEYVWSFADLNM